MRESRAAIILSLIVLYGNVFAQTPMTLDDCRQQALRSNITLKQAESKREQTKALQKAALWEMGPRVTANGAYIWTERSVNLLSEEQQGQLSHIGNSMENDFSEALHQELDGVPLIGDILAERLASVMSNSGITSSLNQMGSNIVDALQTDTRNIGVATVTVTQPIYMGGKLMAAYRTARLLDELSGIEHNKERSATLLAVDEAYWQVVSVQHKVELAQRYADLLDTMENNVEAAVLAEVKTKGDLAQVRVKRNEAQMNLAKATGSLVLAKMLLAQRCGMPLDTVFDIDTTLPTMQNNVASTEIAMDSVYAHRSEMRMLDIADSIALQGIRIAASTLKPNVVASAGYLVSNPNIFDGFNNTWGGTWMAGVAVNIPIAHPAGIYAVKAAKARRKQEIYRRKEAEEMIELQVNKIRNDLIVATKHLEQSMAASEEANENLHLADESFKAGMCSSADLMAAQTAWLKVQSEIVDARIAIAMDRMYLAQALGENIAY